MIDPVWTSQHHRGPGGGMRIAQRFIVGSEPRRHQVRKGRLSEAGFRRPAPAWWSESSLGLKSDGPIVAWGWASYGQTRIPAPNRGFVAVAGGEFHSLGLKDDGSIVAWGRNRYGQTDVPSPNSGFIAVAAGAEHSLGLKGGGGCVRDPAWVCDGDVDGDGQVNPVDAGVVQAHFGSEQEYALCNYDLDCDGRINPVDSGIVQALFGTCDEPREVCP